MSQGQGAFIGDGQGVVTIADDEPRVSINDVSRNEGIGGTTSFVFTITMSPAPDVTITVNYATANSSATSIDDYIAASESLLFTTGQTSKTVSVSVKGNKSASRTKRSTFTFPAARGHSSPTARDSARFATTTGKQGEALPPNQQSRRFGKRDGVQLGLQHAMMTRGVPTPDRAGVCVRRDRLRG